MLNNRFAGEALEKIRKFYEAGIEMNGQIVLCKGINDGRELERTIKDLTAYLPYMESLSVVPVGLTKYRKDLYHLDPFTPEDAGKVLDTIHKWQQYCMEKYHTHFVHAGDEWYLLAGEEFPEAERYDGYIQLENGVGMMRLLYDEFMEALEEGREEAEEALKLRFSWKMCSGARKCLRNRSSRRPAGARPLWRQESWRRLFCGSWRQPLRYSIRTFPYRWSRWKICFLESGLPCRGF